MRYSVVNASVMQWQPAVGHTFMSVKPVSLLDLVRVRR